MRKMFAFLMALAMTVQLVMPAWADVAQEETAETVATEEAQGATEEAAEEPTEEVPEETEGETEEATEGTEAATEETTEESTEALPEETEEEETEPEETVEETEELEATANSGTCGKSAVWTLDGDGHLTISGTGVMEEFIRNAVKKSVLTVTIESGITGIGESCFSGCQNIISIEIPDTVKIISRNSFGGCFALQSVSLPDGVEEIGEYAFTGCKAMETLHLGKGLKVIHDGAFQGDGNLTALRLPEGVETIGDGVFAGCESMTTVGLPKSMTRIGESAFLGCGSITDVYYGGSWADWHSLNIGQYNDSLTGAKIHYGTSHVHDFVYVPEKAATCTEGGNNAYYLCQECQGVFLDEKGDNETTLDAQTLPALGHSMTEVPEKEVTCAEDGNHAYYICGTCHKVYTDALGQTETTVEAQTIQSQGHNMVKTDAVAPTRTTTGNNAYYTCDRCGKVYKDRQGKKETTVEAETLPVLGTLAGSGTQADPYRLYSQQDMELLDQRIESGAFQKGDCCRMEADITIEDSWSGLGSEETPFCGDFDGHGYRLTLPEGSSAVFTRTREATIHDLEVYGLQIADYGLVSIYKVDNANVFSAKFDRVTLVSGSQTLYSGFIGGYASSMNPVYITDCTVESGVTIGYEGGEDHIGSFAGEFNGFVKNCKSSATVRGGSWVGGLVGNQGQSMSDCRIEDCTFDGTVEADGNYVGGILGGGYAGTGWKLVTAPNARTPNILNCRFEGTVHGGNAVGGILGAEACVQQTWYNGTGCIRKNESVGSVSGDGDYVGGIIGFMQSLNRYNEISGNYYENAQKGIGAVAHVDTSAVKRGFHGGTYYYDTSKDSLDDINCTKLRVYVELSSIGETKTGDNRALQKTNHNRDDDPLGADKDKLCRTNSISERTIERLEVSGSYRTTYTLGDALDLTGILIEAVWSDGKRTEVSLEDAEVTGYDENQIGDQILRIRYEDVSTNIKVTVKPKSNAIHVSVSILGDSKHGAVSSPHGLARGGLQTWASDSYFEANTADTVWDVLKRLMDREGLHADASDNNQYGTVFIRSVNGLGEFDNGPNSGWMYTQNGTHPEVGVSARYVKDGDVIVLHYTDDYTYEEGGVNYGQETTLIRPSDTGYLVSGSKLALSAWSMPEEKETSVWWSLAEGGSNYASIDSKGVLTARTVYSAQQVTVIAQPYDGSEQVTKTIWILPKTTGLGLLLDGGPLGSTLNVDQAQTKTLQLSAKVYPDGALQEVSWSSSNESVARVDETGLVTLAKPGTVVIQATTKDGSKLTAQVTLNVTYLDANSKLTLVGEVPQPGLEPGQTVQLTLWGEAAIEAENVVFSVPSNQSAMGSIDGSGLFTAGSTAGNVTVTAALKDDPLGRSASITIPVLPMQAHTVLAVPVLDGVGQVTQRDGVYEAIFRQTEVEGGYRFRLRVHAQNYQGQPLSGKFVYTTTDASIAKVSADGLVTVQKGAEGLCAIGVRAADALGTGTEVLVSVRDYSPRLETNKLTVNSALEEGCSLVLAASYGNDIENVFLSDGRFSCSWEEDKLTISAKESLKNGTYPMTLEVVCADNMYKYTLFVKVTKTLPKVTVKQREKFNLFYQDSSAELKINVAGNLPYHYEFRDNTDFRLDSFDDEARLYFADPQNAPAKPDTKATLRLWLEGYREPVDVKLSIATVNKGPKVTTAVKASTLNTALTTSNTLRVRLNDPEPGSMEAWSGTEGIEAVIDGCDLCLTLSEVKNTTATVYLRDTNWAQPIKLTHKITVTDKLPTLKAASALKLDSLFTQTEAWTELVLSQGNLSLVTAKLTPVAKEGTAAREESDKLSVTYDPDACLIVARIADPDKAPKAGTYSFNCTGILENGGEIPGGVVKVTVVAAKPKVKLSATSVKLNKALNGWERVEIPVTVTGNNRVVDFEGLPECLTYNENTGKLTVMLSEETASGGSYGLYPVVESNETGQRAKLPTKVSFKVQVYTSDKLAVSLSAKGKLNTLDPESSIAYTVTKVSNCLNPVEGVSLEGPDGDKFQVELDTTSAKPVVRLQMLPGQSYATNVGYKVQLRFFVAGREVLSPMQTVKLTQAALKVTAPKSLVYFQAQTGALRFSLAANAPIGEVALSAKTAPELLTALGENGLRFDGSQLELSVTNPAALKAGKSYTLQLEVTPEYNAENVKPTLVKLTVKVMK